MKNIKKLNRIEKKKRISLLKRKIRIGILIILMIFSILTEHIQRIPNWNQIFEKVGLGEEQVPFNNAPLKVIFPDVGQGECAIIVADDEAMMIDAGNPENGEKLIKLLRKYSIKKLDYIVATHPHIDHYGGFYNIIGEIPISNLIIPNTSCVHMDFWSQYNRFLKLAEGIPITYEKAGKSFSLGKGKFTILGPLKEHPEANNMSLIIKFDYGDCSFLFTGDAEKEEELSVLNSGVDLKSQVLKVSHHGSHTSSAEAFVKAVDPDIAVIQCGKGNAYGHPNKDTLNTLGRYGISVYRSDIDGTLFIGSDGKKLSIKT